MIEPLSPDDLVDGTAPEHVVGYANDLLRQNYAGGGLIIQADDIRKKYYTNWSHTNSFKEQWFYSLQKLFEAKGWRVSINKNANGDAVLSMEFSRKG